MYGRLLFRPEGGDAGAGGTTEAAATTEATTTTTTTEAAKPAEGATVVTETKPAETKAAEITYDVKLPTETALDATAPERIVAFAKARGLPNDVAQAALDLVNTEVATARTAAINAYLPGDEVTGRPPGAEWVKQDKAWRDAALADAELGQGKPEQLAKVAETAKRVLGKFADAETAEFLEKTGLGSNPAALRMLYRIGQAMSEGTLAVPGAGGAPSDADRLNAMYPKTAKP